MKKLVRSVLLLGISITPLLAEAQGTYWKSRPQPAGEIQGSLPASKASLVTIDIPALQSRLASGLQLVDMPDGLGGFTSFSLTETQVMDKATAGVHPEIKTYTGTNAQGQELRLTLSPAGVMGRISDGKSILYVQPLKPGQPSVTVVYKAADAYGMDQIKCGVTPQMVAEMKEQIGPGNLSKTTFGDVTKRNYIIAVAATGEYTTWAGSQSNALARIVTTINNVNAVYERDFAITFTVNSPNDILFTNASTDPYSNSTAASPGSVTLNENHTALTTGTTGTAVTNGGGFNLGHVFNAGWTGGLAYTPSVCDATTKGGAASGLDPALFASGPSGPTFDLTVAHEICHQFSGQHSFSGNTGGCTNAINPTTGWEPGSGSTIMAYPGICTGLSYQNNNDPYFHGGNMAQVSSYMINTATCGTNTTSGNNAPVLGITPNAYTIPNGTPFRLSLPATDADGDALTYNWEELDPVGGTGTSSSPSATATSGPQFRSFPPAITPVQYFPSLDGLLTGNLTYEVLPTVARTLNFRGTVRDNKAGAGRTANKDVTVTTASCGPFSITSPTAATSYNANGTNTLTLTWNTAAACVTSPNINIRFSVDGGRTYPYMVVAATPNDGTETFTVPNLPTCAGRFMIESTTGIFFNISPNNITITSTCAANGVTLSPVEPITVPSAGNAALNTTTAPQFGTAITLPITGSITSTDPASQLSANNGSGVCASFSNAVNYDSYTFASGSDGSHTFSLSGSTPFGIVLNLFEETYTPDNPCKNWIASSFNSSTGNIASTLTATLCSKKKYVLLVSSFDNGFPTLPASYGVSVTSPAGATLFTAQPQPTGTNYVYVIVANATGNIKEVRSTPDLSNAAVYTAGSYTIYGYNTSSTAAALNTTYGGGAYTTLYNAALNQTGGLCAEQSQNSRQANIGGVSTPVQLLAFGAKWKGAGKAEISWEVAAEQAISGYVVERSYDASNFKEAARVATGFSGTGYQKYSVLDEAVSPLSQQVYYRLRILENNGSSNFSATAKLDIAQQAGQNTFTIAPNPLLAGKLTATLGLKAKGTVSIGIQDVSGRQLRSLNNTFEAGANTINMDLSDLAPGMYLVVVSGADFRYTVKMIR